MDTIRFLDLLNTYGWIVIVIALERLFPQRPIPLLSRGWISDLIHMFEPYLRAFVIGGVIIFLTPYLSKAPGGGWLATQDLWVNALVLIVVNEVVFYVAHRIMHSVPWLWEFHRVHHSSTTYYSLMTTRFHVVDVLMFRAPYTLIAGYMGARAETVIALSVFQGFVDRFGHSNIRAPHFVGYLMGSPKFHAWHHSNDPAARDKNFSRDFTFLDFIFRTAYYPKDRIAQDFGDPQYPVNYFHQQLLPFWTLGRKAYARVAGLGRTPMPVVDKLSDPPAT